MNGSSVNSKSLVRLLVLVSSATRPLDAPRVSATLSSPSQPMLPPPLLLRRVLSSMVVRLTLTSLLPETTLHQRSVLTTVPNNTGTQRTHLLTLSSLATFPSMLMRTLLVRHSVLTALSSMSDFLPIRKFALYPSSFAAHANFN